MKKHNESKSTMGYRHSKGKALYKVTIFTMIFVMLFCISASAEMTTITVKDQDGNIINEDVDIIIEQNNLIGLNEITKTITIQYEQIYNTDYILRTSENLNYGSYIEGYNGTVKVKYRILTTTAGKATAHTIENNKGDIIISVDNGATPQEVYAKWEELIEPFINNDFSEYITVYKEPPPAPVYEGFIGNARGLFDMLFESIQSIFNWLVSPNVIVFFGLGIILSLTTIGILIARRFFWGR